VVLLVAFGALVASGLPLVVAVTSITLSFAALFFLGQWVEFAVYSQSIVTMLGLATGIDYALLMVNRFREELHKHGDVNVAVVTTTATAGKAVTFSGVTVMIALSALLVPPLGLIQSIGIGSITVLLISVLVSLTALPATLTLLGERVNWGKLTRRELGRRSRPFWHKVAQHVMRRSWLWAVGGSLLLLALSLPALTLEVGDTGPRGLSEGTDTRQVHSGLRALGLEGILRSYDVLIDFGARPGGFYHPSSVAEVSRLSRSTAELHGVERVVSPTTVEGVPGLLLRQYYVSAEVAMESPLQEVVSATVSEDGRFALMRVLPVVSSTPSQGGTLELELHSLLHDLGVSAKIGGDYIGEAEWTRSLYSSFPLAVGLVYLATLITLGLAFRSIVIPIKSIILNTLTVSAAYGVITLIFQHGWGLALVGLSENLHFVDSSAPIFIFAIVFGLSMDYEVFLVTRIYEGHKQGMNDRDAITHALTTTGGVITSAATIMIVVFSMFLLSEVVLIKTLGLGLAVAIFLDATLVRLALVPAVMKMAGKWNWWLPWPVAGLAKRIRLGHD
jgi:RND superfamily putative drug exporter